MQKRRLSGKIEDFSPPVVGKITPEGRPEDAISVASGILLNAVCGVNALSCLQMGV